MNRRASPVVTLHAPKKAGPYWVLSADIAIGNDVFTLHARLTPETLKWAAEKGSRGSRWAQQLTSKIKNYVNFKGNWDSFGDLGKAAKHVLHKVAQHPRLTDYGHVTQALPLYLASQGESGHEAKIQAQDRIAKISEDAATGIPEAVEALDLVGALASADTILHDRQCYQVISILDKQEREGNETSRLILQAIKALGTDPRSSSKIRLFYDVEDAIIANDKAEDLVGYASNVVSMRGMRRTNRLPLHKVKRVFDEVLATRDRVGSTSPNLYSSPFTPLETCQGATPCRIL